MYFGASGAAMGIFKPFTLEDVRRVNRDLIEGKVYDTSGLSPASARIIRESSFTREEINRAYAEARRVISEA
jgi:hypothetical protein